MANSDSFSLTWLGHSTFLFVSPGGKTILIDPWLRDNPKTPEKYKGGFDNLDYLLITHGHSDHFGDAVTVITKNQPTTVATFEIIGYLQTKGLKNGIPVNKGGTVALPGSESIKITAVHADHTSTIDDDGVTINAGEPIGFIIEFENGYTIYDAGDTAVFGDMKIIAEIYQPHLTILPIGDHFTMGPKEAAFAIRLLDAAKVIPMHYGTFPLLTGTPEKLKAELVSRTTEIIVPVIGETMTLSAVK
jgi:L-ascorbate metabolism protein UlaG (beta-lactamase superfamily)